ncbi:helix-turn-helix domain-containing protein [Thiopseudomonas acetoxidans]|uniref:Helix-turn-helix transcriptional regulator n=1 Tax=Thiopseudomonas acetoxidans TaxID=3041622 RepID=A0ABT7STV0_9GAMM|nr:helix-turn-helix transcriptional regulator [Thiopseudomonas sp. CY1220]MCK9236991.1 helix-turn-helix domain-containing protein [Thiopseudomonas sp.]MDM7858977.1 helix-turn-helix transcriptional regulator [Thiopseudomonas sp. CY1220]
MDFYSLAKQVRDLRKEQGISQVLMAEHLQISRATLSAFETGRAGDIGLKKVIAMLDYLGYELNLREKSPFPTFEELLDAQ